MFELSQREWRFYVTDMISFAEKVLLIALNLNQYATGIAQPGLSVERLKGVTIAVPPLADQQKLVAQIEALERDIASAQAVIAAAPAKKQAIMQRYL